MAQDYIITTATNTQLDVLSRIEDTRRWAWDARQDAAHERQLTAARYYIWGFSGEDIEDDNRVKTILAQAYDIADNP